MTNLQVERVVRLVVPNPESITISQSGWYCFVLVKAPVWWRVIPFFSLVISLRLAFALRAAVAACGGSDHFVIEVR